MSDLVTLKITKLVYGGQGLADLPDGRKVFVWNALPGETVRARLIIQKHSYVEAIAEEVAESSAERTTPLEPNFLATSPWQVMTFEAENSYKRAIIKDLLQQQHLSLSNPISGTTHTDQLWQYRNKMEYSFWGDEQGLHLASYDRGSHHKQIVSGSQLAQPIVDEATNTLLSLLDKLRVRAGTLKTIIVRSSTLGRAVGSLFVKSSDFPKLDLLPTQLKGLRVYYSNPKSPASVPTKLLYELGDCRLEETLLDEKFVYDVDSFFQVNLPIFEKALETMRQWCDADEIIDMYAGVGTIGLSLARQRVTLIEQHAATAAMARLNAVKSGLAANVIELSTEKALNTLKADVPLMLDPPRAGLHDKLVAGILSVKPPTVIYLSCNPSTQVRDLAKLVSGYTIKHLEVFNFFPRTPHIETLAVLQRLN